MIIALMLFSVLLASCSQVMLKKAALLSYAKPYLAYLNARVICAYSIFFLTTLISVYALKYVTLITAGFIECSAYIYVLLLDRLFFGQAITPRKIAGVTCIIAGIALCLWQ